ISSRMSPYHNIVPSPICPLHEYVYITCLTHHTPHLTLLPRPTSLTSTPRHAKLHRNKTRRSFAVTHDHLGQLETHEIQRILKLGTLNFGFGIPSKSIRQRDH